MAALSRQLTLAAAACLLHLATAAPSAGGGGCSAGSGPDACVRDDTFGGPGAALGLLQKTSDRHQSPATVGIEQADAAKTDLVLVHIPFNFGHTAEKTAAFGSGPTAMASFFALETALETIPNTQMQWAAVQAATSSDSVIWGHLNPDLLPKSEVTGCPLYFTPGKHWPTDIAQAYFGNKTSFGMLRDPYERLVALFRGEMKNYGGTYPEFFKTCDVNGAVKQMMRDYMAGHKYMTGCTFVPQAEYFDEPFGIKVAVDNRRFPDSLNELFAEHAFPRHIETEDSLHVTGCPEVWAGDLDCETKALVRQVYARDFELLCTKFGYCDHDENCCIQGVPQMCPSNLEEKRKTATYCKEASSQ